MVYFNENLIMGSKACNDITVSSMERNIKGYKIDTKFIYHTTQDNIGWLEATVC